MTHKSTNKTMNSSSEFRAKCEKCRYTGNWTVSEEEANEDAIKHMSLSENETHVVNVIVRQKSN